MNYAKLSLGALAVGCLLGGGTLLATSGNAAAGTKSTVNVVVNLTTRVAGGSLGTARNSASGNEYIGCSLTSFLGGDVMVVCSARMSGSSPPTASCSIHNSPGVIQAMSAMNGDSYITFEWDSNNVCTKLAVTNDSRYEPKVP